MVSEGRKKWQEPFALFNVSYQQKKLSQSHFKCQWGQILSFAFTIISSGAEGDAGFISLTLFLLQFVFTVFFVVSSIVLYVKGIFILQGKNSLHKCVKYQITLNTYILMWSGQTEVKEMDLPQALAWPLIN